MKTSIVMAVYNGEKYILEQLISITEQSKQIDEAIIIDDCSTDNSYNIVEQFIKEHDLDNWKLIKNNKNLGYRDNFKKGLKFVTGDIIFLADQDDIWHKEKVEIMVKYMDNTKILSLASSFNFIDQDGKIFEVKLQKGKANNNLLFQTVNEEITEIELYSLLKKNFSQGCTMALKKELVKEYLSTSDGNLPHDWELNILAASYNGCYYLDIPLIDYRIHNNNTIGLEKIVNHNIINEKGERINQRIDLVKAEREHVKYALSLSLNSKLKKYCVKNEQYLNKRINYLENNRLLSTWLLFFTGGYRFFGSIKTFVGDIICILKNRLYL